MGVIVGIGFKIELLIKLFGFWFVSMRFCLVWVYLVWVDIGGLGLVVGFGFCLIVYYLC